MWFKEEEVNKAYDEICTIEELLGDNPSQFRGSTKDRIEFEFKRIEQALGIKKTPPAEFTRFEWIVLKILELQAIRTNYEKRIDASISDPFFNQVRKLMPDEIVSIKDISTKIANDDSNTHSRCAMTNLLLIRTMVSD